MNHDFIIANVDTDAILFTKSDGSPISKEEQESLLNEINSLMPEKIKFDHDGYFPKVLITKAKNYVLLDEAGKIKIKGSALKATMKEKALQEFIKELINLLLDDRDSEIVNLYNKYCKEIISPKLDIARWTSKKTITKSVLDPKRSTEEKILDACGDMELQEGNKIRVYFDTNEALKLEEDYSGDHNVDRLLEKVYKTIKVFNAIVDMKVILNYSLKKNKKFMELL